MRFKEGSYVTLRTGDRFDGAMAVILRVRNEEADVETIPGGQRRFKVPFDQMEQLTVPASMPEIERMGKAIGIGAEQAAKGLVKGVSAIGMSTKELTAAFRGAAGFARDASAAATFVPPPDVSGASDSVDLSKSEVISSVEKLFRKGRVNLPTGGHFDRETFDEIPTQEALRKELELPEKTGCCGASWDFRFRPDVEFLQLIVECQKCHEVEGKVKVSRDALKRVGAKALRSQFAASRSAVELDGSLPQSKCSPLVPFDRTRAVSPERGASIQTSSKRRQLLPDLENWKNAFEEPSRDRSPNSLRPGDRVRIVAAMDTELFGNLNGREGIVRGVFLGGLGEIDYAEVELNNGKHARIEIKALRRVP